MGERWRIERDSLGEVRVPAEKRWGPQTQRALENFPIGEDRFPLALIHAIGRVKQASARAHRSLGTLPGEVAGAIEASAEEVALGRHDDEFPLVVWQTGSGTQSNMNVNEVVAHLASERLGRPVHPNDEVNRGQSSNDVIPTALHVAAAEAIDRQLLPSVIHLRDALVDRARRWNDVVKIGRTHWMDAVPLTLGQEVGGWAALVDRARERIVSASGPLMQVALGGTAVGTGLNAPPGFADRAVAELAALTGRPFQRAPDPFAALSFDDAPIGAHSAFVGLAAAAVKIANDIRFLGSGPRCGIGELLLPENEPGSSIMPGKTNPTQAEALIQVGAQVIGNHAALTFAATQAFGQLATTRPQIGFLLLWSARILSDGCRSFADRCVAGLEPDRERLASLVERSLMLVTALTPHIGYDLAAEIARRAHATGSTLREAAIALGIDGSRFDQWVRPEGMVGR